jgi:hypothetical protein
MVRFANSLKMKLLQLLIICKYSTQSVILRKIINKTAFLENIINDNEYIKNCKSTKKKDISSLSYLIDRDLSQSDCIKLGNSVELVIKDIIIKTNPDVIDIRPTKIKGKKEKDHLFLCEQTKTIFYAEIKSNLKLDTEKCKMTSLKCLQIQKELKKEYPCYKINMYLVGSRYLHKKLIPQSIMNKYEKVQKNVLGINDYLNLLNVPFCFKNDEYVQFLNKIADACFIECEI